jgi:hypothetical protein
MLSLSQSRGNVRNGVLSILLCRAAVELVNLRIALVVRGKAPALYILIVGIKRSLNNIECVRVRPQEHWLEAWVQADHILIHEDLAAA